MVSDPRRNHRRTGGLATADFKKYPHLLTVGMAVYQLADAGVKLVFNPFLYKPVGCAQSQAIAGGLRLQGSNPGIKLLGWKLIPKVIYTPLPSC
jgi:hypothetical protein